MHDTVAPVIAPEVLRDLATQCLAWTKGTTASVRIGHTATGTVRLSQSRVRLNDSGDSIGISLSTKFGQRVSVRIDTNQLDRASLRQAVEYLDRIASEQPGDPTSIATPFPPRQYGPNTSWKENTAEAFYEARHHVLPALVRPLLSEQLTAAAFAGVFIHSTAYVTKTGIMAFGQQTDTEITAIGWSADGKGSGWAGQAARDWAQLKPDVVGAEALRLTQLAANPVALEPGRRTAILGRPAVVQLVRTMGGEFSIIAATSASGVFYNRTTQKPKLGEKVMDERISVSSDPNDPDGGYLPFNRSGDPLIKMSWIERGVLTHLAWPSDVAARNGFTPSNDPPLSIRVSGGDSSIEEMIASCEEGIYVNRFSQIQDIGGGPGIGLVTGVTNGGCFLVRHGKIEKSIKNLRFVASPWHILSRPEKIGSTERTAFGYAPWAGSWPIDPMIVPPIMVRDFNFTALAEAV